MLKHVIIVAGGSGNRFQSKVPKQFFKLGDKCVLMHGITAFYSTNPRIKIIVALPEEHLNLWEDLCKEYNFTIPHKISKGGETRFHSVKNALEHINEEGLVAVHDGVRPLVSSKLIQNSFTEAEEFGNAIPVVSVNDSVRMIKNDSSRIIDRSSLKFIQTPQCFNSRIIKNAYQQDYHETFTDDASVVESIGEKIHLVEGDQTNIKITTDVDLVIAEHLLLR